MLLLLLLLLLMLLMLLLLMLLRRDHVPCAFALTKNLPAAEHERELTVSGISSAYETVLASSRSGRLNGLRTALSFSIPSCLASFPFFYWLSLTFYYEVVAH